MINEKMLGLGKKSSTIRELFEYGKARKAEIGEENVYDFSLGNPAVAPPKEVDDAIKNLIDNTDSIALHGYTSAVGDNSVREKIADDLNEKYGAGVDSSLIYMTCGAAASLTISLHAVVNEGDEVIVLAPFFPEYRVFAEKAGAKVVVVTPNERLKPDLSALANAITEKTKAIIVNYPNNPSGVILNETEVWALTEVLKRKEKEYGNRIFLISDEPYRELNYGNEIPFFASFYDDTIVCYSFSKSMSLPGERIGYIAINPKMNGARDVFFAVCGAGRSLGFVCAPSLWQKVIGECIGKTSDMSFYEENREILYQGLKKIGYNIIKPEGAFYMFVKAPDGNSRKFCEEAKKYELLIVPSDDFGLSGYARISYCVSTETIVNSMPSFEKLIKNYKE